MAEENNQKPMSFYLVNLYDGRLEHVSDTRDQLVDYLREKHDAGTLMAEVAYSIFQGKQLSTSEFWKLVLQRGREVDHD